MQVRQTLDQLGRSKHDQMIAGVCAGFAQTTQTPVWLWRAGFTAAAAFGAGLCLYLILWYFMPLRDGVA